MRITQRAFKSLRHALGLVVLDELGLERRLPAATALELLPGEHRARPTSGALVGTAIRRVARLVHQVSSDGAFSHLSAP